MQRNRPLVALVLIGCALVTALGLQAPTGASMPPEPATADVAPNESERGPRWVESEAAQLERAAKDALGDGYGGLWRADDGTLVVARTAQAAQARLDVGDADLVEVERPLTELESTKALLDEVAPSLIAEGVRLSWWVADPRTNSVLVEVIGDAGDVEAARTAVQARLGDVPLTVRAVERGAQRTSRTSDPSPHKGGAKIYNAYATCSSAFRWEWPDGHFGMLTAGHCADIWVLWLTDWGWYGGSGTTWQGLDQPGTGRIDVAELAPIYSYSFSVYTGGPTSNTSVTPWASDGTWQNGQTGIKTNGAIIGTYQQGSGNVINTNGTVAFWDGAIFVDTVYHINRAQCTALPGDSGGAVWWTAAQGIVLAGVLAAWSGVDGECFYTPLKPIVTSTSGLPG